MVRITLEDNVQGREIGNYFYHIYYRDNIGVYVAKRKRGQSKLVPEYILTINNISDAQNICYSLNTARKPVKDAYNYILKKYRYGSVVSRKEIQDSLE